MKSQSTFFLRRGLALTGVALSLTCFDGLALTKASPAQSSTPAAHSLAPATGTAPPPATRTDPSDTPGAAMEDIRDIRGPKPIPSPWLWAWWLAGGAALATLLYTARFKNHRSTLRPGRLPYEIALDRLEEARVLMQPENAREFSILISEIVRHYMEARFKVRAARRTTEEFLHDLLQPSDTLLASHRELLADFLRHCDLAKFARWILSMGEMETMLRSARAFVLETGPVSRPETEPSAGSRLPTQPQTVLANP